MKTTKLRTIFLTALCAGGCSEPGGPPAAECDVRIAWDRGTFQEMTSVPVENKEIGRASCRERVYVLV